MDLELNEKEQKLKVLLMEIPPNLVGAEQLLQQDTYTTENISKVGTDFVRECVEISWEGICEWEGFCDEVIARTEEVIPGLHSTYICEVLELLLRYGLDPNLIFGAPHSRHNIMNDMKYLDNGFLAADALVMLFEHGGNPNLICDGFSIFEDIDFEVFFDAVEQRDRQRYSSLVHCWIVYLAYGAALTNGNPIGTLCGRFDIRELRNHRQFYFGITSGENGSDIHIFRKETMWEVFRA